MRFPSDPTNAEQGVLLAHGVELQHVWRAPTPMLRPRANGQRPVRMRGLDNELLHVGEGFAECHVRDLASGVVYLITVGDDHDEATRKAIDRMPTTPKPPARRVFSTGD